MPKIKNLIVLILLAPVYSGCTLKEEFNFHGKWQSLNNRGFAIEIDENDEYTFEFHRTNDLSSFEELMNGVRSQSEELVY